MDEIKIRSIIEFMQVPKQVFFKELYVDKKKVKEEEKDQDETPQ